MTEITLNNLAHALEIAWPDGVVARFPYIWLRDNCPAGFHPQTDERTFDLLSVPLDLTPASVAQEAGEISIAWKGSDHVSRFGLDWLRAHRPGQPLADAADIAALNWRGDLGADSIPVGEAEKLLDSDDELLSWANDTKRFGLSLVRGLRDDPEAGMQIAERIGFLRETNFGRTFEVVSKPDPNNLAYTAHALPLHTDLTNQELPPGFQFLHAIANEAEGGGSLFCDGFAIAEDLRQSDPEAFSLLAETPIPMRFHDRDYDIRRRDTVIRTGRDGRLAEIRFNAHLAGVFDMPADRMHGYYRAYRQFMAATRGGRYVIGLKLKAGEMVVFDNRRVLHGRGAFDPSTGFRHLRGCYVDRGEWDSRIRVLSRS